MWWCRSAREPGIRMRVVQPAMSSPRLERPLTLDLTLVFAVLLVCGLVLVPIALSLSLLPDLLPANQPIAVSIIPAGTRG
jgi:hypothetical protein